MDKIKLLYEIYPEVKDNQEVPLILADTQCLSGLVFNQDENCLEWEMGRQKAIISLYDNIPCILRYSPHKNISRMFE